MDDIDIVSFNRIPFHFAMKILERGRLLFSKNENIRRRYIGM